MVKMKYAKELSIEELAALKDEDIDFSDIPKLDEEFWKNAKLVMPENASGMNTGAVDPRMLPETVLVRRLRNNVAPRLLFGFLSVNWSRITPTEVIIGVNDCPYGAPLCIGTLPPNGVSSVDDCWS